MEGWLIIRYLTAKQYLFFNYINELLIVYSTSCQSSNKCLPPVCIAKCDVLEALTHVYLHHKTPKVVNLHIYERKETAVISFF